MGRKRGWGRPDTRLCLSGLSVVLAKSHVDADVDDDEEEEEEEESLGLVPQGRRVKSTGFVRHPSCCWAHWSTTVAAAVVDGAAAAAAAAAASSCVSDGTLEPVGEFLTQEDNLEEAETAV